MSTFRVDLVAHLRTIAQAYATANPTLLRKVWSARPGSFAEVPAVYIGDRPETGDSDSGTETRTIDTSVVVVDTFGDNEQTVGRMDVIVDALVSAYRLAANAGVGTGIIERVGNVEDGELAVSAGPDRPAIVYRTATISLTAHVQEGRV